jgi:microcystin-dependent protein
MADPFVAEIRIFPFSFAPKGWAFCNGQLMPLSQNTALFSLVGTYYGGDGKSTFALPNLEGNVPMHPGQGQGLSLRDLGESSGSPTVTLLESEMPIHNHLMMASTPPGTLTAPASDRGLARMQGGNAYVPGNPLPPLGAMAFQILAPTGSSFPHNNMQPSLTLNFFIALQGVYPPRT